MARITCKNCNAKATETTQQLYTANGSKENYACNNIYIYTCVCVCVCASVWERGVCQIYTPFVACGGKQSNATTRQQTNRPEVTFSFQTFPQHNIKAAEWRAQNPRINSASDWKSGRIINLSAHRMVMHNKTNGKAILKSINFAADQKIAKGNIWDNNCYKYRFNNYIFSGNLSYRIITYTQNAV